MTYQLAIRIPDELTEGLDHLVAEGRFANRTEAVRYAIAQLVDIERRAAVGAAIVAGYAMIPETAEELATAEANLQRLVAEEPW
ncbi:MAG: ribbon-helix-helix domain-containing protein [Acidimicrobiales bacterium]